MKECEVMIGDKVTYAGEVVTIVGIYIYKGFVIRFKNGTEKDVKYDDVKPIRLTTEMFEKANDYTYHREDCDYTSPCGRVIARNNGYTNSNNEWYIHFDNCDMDTLGAFECTYVHQLQDMFRLCGMYDYAETFKVQ